MKFAKTLLAATLVATLPTAAYAQMRALSDPVVPHPNPESLFTSSDPVLHRNKQAALHIQRELLKCNEWGRASEWLTDRYIQHNPVAASGLQGVVYYFTQIARRQPLSPCPALSAEDGNGVVAVQAEGDYVTILTRRIVPYADDPSQSYTTTWFDTWRFVDGKADEHWDPATLPTAAPQPTQVTMTPEGAAQRVTDLEAIEELMWRYERALDRFQTEDYVALFTEDGSFGQTRGHDALRAFMNGFANSENPPRLQHASSNHWVEFTGADTARIHYYWQTYRLGEGQGNPPTLLAVGNGVDTVVRRNGRWLFQNRNVTPTVEAE
jgi:predicted SnoaL-like aldol condensation-catalyzing enzyme